MMTPFDPINNKKGRYWRVSTPLVVDGGIAPFEGTLADAVVLSDRNSVLFLSAIKLEQE